MDEWTGFVSPYRNSRSPQGSRPEWGLTGTDWDWDWDWDGRTGGLATLQLPKPRNPMSWAMGSGHLAPAPFKRSEHARTGVRYQSTYEGTRMPRYTRVPLPRPQPGKSGGDTYPVPDIMPQTGGQRAFRQVHPGPLRFHPPTPKLPERPLIAAYCTVRCQAQRRGEGRGRYMVPYRIPHCRPSPSPALAHGPCPCSWAGGSSTQQQGTQASSKVQQLTSSCKSEIKSHRFLRAQAGRLSSSKITLHTKHYTSQKVQCLVPQCSVPLLQLDAVSLVSTEPSKLLIISPRRHPVPGLSFLTIDIDFLLCCYYVLAQRIHLIFPTARAKQTDRAI